MAEHGPGPVEAAYEIPPFSAAMFGADRMQFPQREIAALLGIKQPEESHAGFGNEGVSVVGIPE
jgi:hypothetical protein